MDTRKFGSAKARKRVMSWVLCGLLALAPATAMADTLDMSKNAGLGVGSAVATLLYAPVKLCYALGGLVIGGLAWGFSGGDNSVAEVVLTPSVLGDYVITPAHLRGDKPVEFFGRESAPKKVAVSAAPGSDRAW